MHTIIAMSFWTTRD